MARAPAGRRREDTVDIGPLADSLGFMLRLAQIRAFERFFADFGELGLTPGALSVLVVIARNPGIRQGSLARRLHIKPANMTKTIRALEAMDLVRRTVPEDDRRAIEISLTDEAAALAPEMMRRLDRHERTAYGPLGPGEREQLMQLLARYVGIEAEDAR